MTTHPFPRSCDSAGDHALTPLAPQDITRHDGWTPARQAAFLRELAATHNVAAAARSVGMSRQSAYQLRARLRGEPFDAAWEAAFVTRFDVLAEAALDRALNGVEVPHYYNGELLGTSRRYDERLTLALLARRNDLARPRPHMHHPASAFDGDDIAGLAERVEHGPEEWLDSPNEELDARYGAEETEDSAVEGADEGAAEGAGPFPERVSDLGRSKPV